ncbi:MAG: pyridoxal-phosphate dependent enzyme [Sediminibacterium sp.]
MQTSIQSAKIQTLKCYTNANLQVDVLRLDEIHPIVNGNKWFKLQYYLADAIQNNKTEIASFGGAYSNHIVALAFACKTLNLKSTGFIRGEKSEAPSATLIAAANYGMNLQYVNRTDYNNKEALINLYNEPNRYWIPEGGYGVLGAQGASKILEQLPSNNYTHILCSVGSGTMAAGIVNATTAHQQVIGISSLKNNADLERQVLNLVLNDKRNAFTLLHQYHFGGYAKHPAELITFMKEFYAKTSIPTDIVYTGKLFFAMNNLIKENYFDSQTKLLVIHCGGLQGNLSLPKGILPF